MCASDRGQVIRGVGEPGTGAPPAYAIESVDNALRLLLVLRRDGSLRVSTAADELGVARSTAHRLLAMLRYRGFVVQDPDRSYRAGAALLDSRGTDPVSLAGLARVHLEWLAGQVRETVLLMVLDGADVRFVDSVEASQVLRVGSRTGVCLPACRTSGGKVLLAELPRAEFERRHPDLAGGPQQRAALLRVLGTTRRRGYGTNFGESEAGLTALGVAVRDAAGSAIAAVAVAAPTVRYRRGQILDLLPVVRVTADRIRQELLGGSRRADRGTTPGTRSGR